MEYNVTVINGTTNWYKLNGKLHREDGPAIEYSDGGKCWYKLNGKRRREDGPAIEYSNGGKQWYIDDKKVSESTVMTKRNYTVEEHGTAELEDKIVDSLYGDKRNIAKYLVKLGIKEPIY